MKWKIEKIESSDNIIKRVYFSVSKTENKDTFVYGDVFLNGSFDGIIPNSDAREDDVIEWTKISLGESSVSRYEQLADKF